MKKSMKTRLSEGVSIFVAKSPAKAVLLIILLFNICFLCLAALVISCLAPDSLAHSGFWASVFYTVTMILDAGCIQFVVADVGEAGVAVIVICLLIVVVGMVTFTGAVIGYLSNYIAGFIEQSNAGAKKLKISDHTVILNWNSRASEIVNDMLYSEQAEKVVVLVPDKKEAIEREIADRLADTLERERKSLYEVCKGKSRLEVKQHKRKNGVKNQLTVIVRQGDVFSSKQLNDIAVDQAKTVIILGKDILNTMCRYELKDELAKYEFGNIDIVKGLIQVADITGAETSADNQKIVVEVSDEWTMALVQTIIAHKERKGKCNIVPVPVNRILGQILSQFSIMPELNMVYSELFSNKGAFFTSRPITDGKKYAGEDAFVWEKLTENKHCIPLTIMDTKDGLECFYVTGSEKVVGRKLPGVRTDFTVKLNKDFWFKKKNVIILGHNSEIEALMMGFDAFRQEWNFADGREILDLMVIDEKESLEKNDYFRKFPFVTKVVEAEVYDRDLICKMITEFADVREDDTSVLILSDDMVPADEIDAKVLTYLIYVRDIVHQKMKADPTYDPTRLDIVVEVLDTKNYDVVRSYSVNNVVISNRYISKMMTQIGEKEAIFDFYNDILTYDVSGCTAYESKELYIKTAREFFEEVPPTCTADELIRAVYEAGPVENRSILLGYIRNEIDTVFFVGDQSDIQVTLRADDKLVIFSNH